MPLVNGESLLDGRVRVENGSIVGVLAPDQQQTQWSSALTPVATLELTAPPVSKWTEQWTLVPSNFWDVHYDGTASGLAPMSCRPTWLPGRASSRWAARRCRFA